MDLYVVVAIALLASGASVLGLVDSDVVQALTLAVLALLAISLLVLRNQLVEVSRRRTNGSSAFGLLPSHFSESLEQADDVFLCGSTLSGFAEFYWSDLMSVLRKGASLRVLVIDPMNQELHNYINQRLPVPFSDTDEMKQAHLQRLRVWTGLRDESGGDVEVRVMDSVPSLRAYIVSGRRRRELAVVKFYLYRSTGEETNRMWVNLEDLDPTQNRFIRNEIDRMWADGTVWTSSELPT